MKPITERIDSITIQYNPCSWYKIAGISKNTIVIFGNEGNVQFPIAYIKKPKGISLEDWNIIKSKLQITLLK
jgi:hypothetical protein